MNYQNYRIITGYGNTAGNILTQKFDKVRIKKIIAVSENTNNVIVKIGNINFFKLHLIPDVPFVVDKIEMDINDTVFVNITDSNDTSVVFIGETYEK